MIELLWNRAEQPSALLLLAHGAGAPMDSDFMNLMAEAIAGRGVSVVRFEFPYMVRRREDGARRPPDRQPVLLETWRAVIDELGSDGLVIGGKSMGGRAASMIYEDLPGVVGLACLGYPFHPPGKPERLRVEHLYRITKPVLVIQGERDALGNREEVDGYQLPRQFQVEWLEDGDHSFKPRKASGYTQEQHLQQAVQVMADWLGSLA